MYENDRLQWWQEFDSRTRNKFHQFPSFPCQTFRMYRKHPTQKNFCLYRPLALHPAVAMLTRLRSYRASISTPDTHDDGIRNAVSCDAITSKLHHHSTFIKELYLPPWKETVGNNYQTEPSQSYWVLPGLQGGRKHITQYRNIPVTNIIQFLATEVKVLQRQY